MEGKVDSDAASEEPDGSNTADPEALRRLLEVSQSAPAKVWAVARGKGGAEGAAIYKQRAAAMEATMGVNGALLQSFEDETMAQAWLDENVLKPVWAVARGHATGLFYNIDSALNAVEGFPNSFWKDFKCVSEAKAWLQSEEKKLFDAFISDEKGKVAERAGSDEDMPQLHTPPPETQKVLFQKAGHVAVYKNAAEQLALEQRVAVANANVAENTNEVAAAVASCRAATYTAKEHALSTHAALAKEHEAKVGAFAADVSLNNLSRRLEQHQVSRALKISEADSIAEQMGELSNNAHGPPWWGIPPASGVSGGQSPPARFIFD